MLGLELIEKVLPILKTGEYLKTKESMDQVADALLQVKHFYTLIRYESQKSYLMRFIQQMEVKIVQKGDILYEKNKANEGLYIILQGEFSLWEPKSQGEINNEINLIAKIDKFQAADQSTQTEEAKKKEQQALFCLNFIRKKEDDDLLRNQKNNYFLTGNVCALKRMRYNQVGDSLNEECVVSGAKTQYTALAQKDSILLAISAKEYLQIFDLEISKLNFISEVLAKNFANSKDDSIRRLAYKFKEELFPYGSMVFHQEDPSNLFMIVKSGLVEISKVVYNNSTTEKKKDIEKQSKKSETTDQNSKLKIIEEIKDGNKPKQQKDTDIEGTKKKTTSIVNKSIGNVNKSSLNLNKKLSKLNNEDEDQALREYQKYYGSKTNNNYNNNHEDQQQQHEMNEEEQEEQYIADIAKEREERNLEKGLLLGDKKNKKQSHKKIEQSSVLEPMKYTHSGQLIRLGIIGPGEVLGLDDFIKHRQRTYSAKSLAADTLVYYITRSKIDDIINLNEDFNLKKAMRDQATKKTDWHNNQSQSIERINKKSEKNCPRIEDLSANLFQTKKQLQQQGNLNFKTVVQRLFDDRRTQIVEDVLRKESYASPFRLENFSQKDGMNFIQESGGQEGKTHRIQTVLDGKQQFKIDQGVLLGQIGNYNNHSFNRRTLDSQNDVSYSENQNEIDNPSLQSISILKNKRRSINQDSPKSRLASQSPLKNSNQNLKTVGFLDPNEFYGIKRDKDINSLNHLESSVVLAGRKLKTQQSLDYYQFSEKYENIQKEKPNGQRNIRENQEQFNDKPCVTLPAIKKRLSLGSGNNSSLQHFPELEYKNRFSTIFDENDTHVDSKQSNFHLPRFSSLKNLTVPPSNTAASNQYSQKLDEQQPIQKDNSDTTTKDPSTSEKAPLGASPSSSLIRNYQIETAALSLRQKILYKISNNLRFASRFKKYNAENSKGFIEAKKFVKRLRQAKKGLAEPQPNPLQNAKEQHLEEMTNFVSSIKNTNSNNNIQEIVLPSYLNYGQNNGVPTLDKSQAGNNRVNTSSNNIHLAALQNSINQHGKQQHKNHKTSINSNSLLLVAQGNHFQESLNSSEQPEILKQRSPALIRSLSPISRESSKSIKNIKKHCKHLSEHVASSVSTGYQLLGTSPSQVETAQTLPTNSQSPKTQPECISTQQATPKSQDSSSLIPKNNQLIQQQSPLNPFTLPSLIPSKSALQMARQNISPQISFSVKMSRKNIANKFSEVYSSPKGSFNILPNPSSCSHLSYGKISGDVKSKNHYSLSNSVLPSPTSNIISQQNFPLNNHFYSAQLTPKKQQHIYSNPQLPQDRSTNENSIFFNPGNVLFTVNKLDTAAEIKLKIQQRQQRISHNKTQPNHEIMPIIGSRATSLHKNNLDVQGSQQIPMNSGDNTNLIINALESTKNKSQTNLSNKILSAVLSFPEHSKSSNYIKRDQRKDQLISAGQLSLLAGRN